MRSFPETDIDPNIFSARDKDENINLNFEA